MNAKLVKESLNEGTYNETVIDVDGNELKNLTGYPVRLKENGKLGLSGIKEGDDIYVSTYMGAEHMKVTYIEGNLIFCDVDGIETCVRMTKDRGRLIFKDYSEA